ncbi:MAG: cytochrome c biogenesis protein ResB [Planctomycetota bacterium]
MTATASTPSPGAAAAVPLPQSAAPWALLLRGIGSMRLAVVIVVLLALLTWLGTLAQSERSTHDVQREYFESWFVLAELPLSVWGRPLITHADGSVWPLRIPLPGAYLLLGLLFVNLIVGGLYRLRWSMRNAGILITHFGIAFLLAAGFVKMHFSYSGSMLLYETPGDGNKLPGRSYEAARFQSFHDFELALLIDRGDAIEERVVQEQVLWAARDDGSVTLRGDGLPFTVQVHHWVDHAQPLPKGPNVRTTMPVVDGAFLREQTWPAGVQPKSEQEIAGCYVTVIADGQPRIEGILFGMPRTPSDENRYPFAFTVQGQRYGLDLRHVMYDLPFGLRLDRFQKLDHPGTISPRDFRSFVSVLGGAAPQEAQVFMNNPLRKDSFVVYQSGWGPQPRGGPPWYSGFEIAYNPSDVWPAVGCFVIAIGLLVHFVQKLVRFLQSSTRQAMQA